jgi:hypothetical protein
MTETTDSAQTYTEDILAMPVPLSLSFDEDIVGAAFACGCMFKGQSLRDEDKSGRMYVLMPNGWKMRVCLSARREPLIAAADDECDCFVLVWPTGDAKVWDVRGVVSKKRLRQEATEDDKILRLAESKLSPPMAMQVEFNTYPIKPDSIPLSRKDA